MNKAKRKGDEARSPMTAVPATAVLPSVDKSTNGKRSHRNYAAPVPLFVTPHSLSSKSAIGTQTSAIIAEVGRSNHLYWNEVESQPLGEHSIRVESWIFGRVSVFKRSSPSRLIRALGACGLSWWSGNQLKPRKAEWLKRALCAETSIIYAAICEVRDAQRVRSVICTIDKPFVLHIWDLLDDHQTHEESTVWLIRNAKHVFCCSEPIQDLVRQVRADASILRFRRAPSAHTAKAPVDTPLRIALIGYCFPYKDGLRLLNDALDLLRSRGIATEVCYVGSNKRMKRWSHLLPGKVSATGFLHSDDERDRALAGCHVGFLPGPLNPPDKDWRSRFSIPSRILDFLATGLPCVATVHLHSATNIYMEKLGLTKCIAADSAEQLADHLSALASKDYWEQGQSMSQEAFRAAQKDWGDLRPWLEFTASESSPT